jgi:hypothetical protein
VEGVKGRRQHVALIVILVLLTAASPATECIIGTKFRVRHVCGEVRDAHGARIPNAAVQLRREGKADVVAEAKTASDGTFEVPDIATGDCEIHVKVMGFWDGVGLFHLSARASNTRCAHPIRVVMKVAGSCSYVENAFEK